MDELLRAIEATLFASAEPLTVDELQAGGAASGIAPEPLSSARASAGALCLLGAPTAAVAAGLVVHGAVWLVQTITLARGTLAPHPIQHVAIADGHIGALPRRVTELSHDVSAKHLACQTKRPDRAGRQPALCLRAGAC